MARRRIINLTIEGVPVKLRRRPDGGLRLYSDAMPGLILSGKDWWDILSDAEPAIKVIRAYRPLASPSTGEAMDRTGD